MAKNLPSGETEVKLNTDEGVKKLAQETAAEVKKESLKKHLASETNPNNDLPRTNTGHGTFKVQAVPGAE